MISFENFQTRTEEFNSPKRFVPIFTMYVFQINTYNKQHAYTNTYVLLKPPMEIAQPPQTGKAGHGPDSLVCS